MQTPNLGQALGRYSHVRMVPVPDWLPQRRAPRSASGRAKASGLTYERNTIAAIHLAFENKQAISQLESSLFVPNSTDFSCNLENATVALRSANSNIIQSNIIKNKQIQIDTPQILASQWIEYQRNNIKHLCQPDLLIIFPNGNDPGSIIPPTNHPRGNVPGSIFLPTNHLLSPLLIICCEIKLTYTPIAIKKLNRLYLPLVDSIFHPSILLPLVICKNLTGSSPPHAFNLLSALSNPLPLVTYGSGNFRII